MDPDRYRKRWEETQSDIRECEGEIAYLEGQEAILRARREDVISDLAELQRQSAWFAAKAGMDMTPGPCPNPELSKVHATKENHPALPSLTNTQKGAAHSPVRHADVIETVLRASQHPLRINEIVEALEKRGHALPEQPNIRFNTIYSAMRRRPKVFRNLGNGRWGLVERDSSPFVWGNPESEPEPRPQPPESEDFGDLNLIPS